MERARGKLALASQPLPPGGFWEDLCFLTQQAAELAIKAVYQVHGWNFPFVHNLRVLLDGLERQGLEHPPGRAGRRSTQHVRRASSLSGTSRPHYPSTSSRNRFG